MRIGIVRYCLKGHWDDNGAPIYMRRPWPRELVRDNLIQKQRLESVKFCLICGSELLSACQECGASLQYGADDDPPQHLPVDATPVEGTGETEVPASRTISAPVGHVKAFKTWVSNTWVKIAPSAGRVVSKVATDYVEKKIGL